MPLCIVDCSAALLFIALVYAFSDGKSRSRINVGALRILKELVIRLGPVVSVKIWKKLIVAGKVPSWIWSRNWTFSQVAVWRVFVEVERIASLFILASRPAIRKG